jgi:hypothetical protein
MRVSRHAEQALVGLNDRLPIPASVVIERLRSTPDPKEDVAIEIVRLQFAHGDPDYGTHGDSLVVVVRLDPTGEGVVTTAMLRKSWAQAFTPAAFSVKEVTSWHQR